MTYWVDFRIVNCLLEGLVHEGRTKPRRWEMVKNAELMRLEEGPEGTFGVLRLNGRVYCVTLEPPDRENQRNVSCIPPGTYTCRSVDSPRFGRTYEITGVPDRSHILFHAGNQTHETKGCILLGRKFGSLNGSRGVLESSGALAGFIARIGEAASFEITIIDAY
jgi:hypothetical protein